MITVPDVLLDNWNRANGNLGTNWTDYPSSGVGITLAQIDNNQVRGGGGAGSLTVWNATVFNAAQGAFVTVAVVPNNGEVMDVAIRLNGAPTLGSTTCYSTRLTKAAGTDTLTLLKTTAGAGSAMSGGTFNQEVNTGDAFGCVANGNVISAIYRPSGGAWSVVGQVTDSSYPGTGNVGLLLTGTTSRIDDFYGGNIVNRLAGTSGINLAPTGTLTRIIQLNATTAIALVASGSISRRINLVGSSLMSLAAAGALSKGISLSGSSGLAAGISGSLSKGVLLTGSSPLVLAAQAELVKAIHLLGSANIQLNVVGDLDVGASVIALEGHSQIALQVSGEITRQINLIGTSRIGMTAQANLDIARHLSGVAGMHITPTGILGVFDLSLALPDSSGIVIDNEITGILIKMEDRGIIL